MGSVGFRSGMRRDRRVAWGRIRRDSSATTTRSQRLDRERSVTSPPSLTASFGPFDLDEADARLLRDGRPLALTPKAFSVLCALARQPGQLMTKDALLDAVWGHRHVSESVLKTTISELRAALGDDARSPRYIETASRRGYRFIGIGATSVAANVPPAAAEPEAPVRPGLIGRQAALETLRALWRKGLAGQRQIVWITGEPGVGKTTLIQEFLSEIDPRMWSHGQCVEQYGAGEPYLPVLEGLGVLCQRDPELPAKLRAAAPTWLMQMPKYCSEADRAVLRQELAGATPERMMRELREATDPYSFDHPLLFVTEDLHWSDRATLRLLDYLARSREPARGMWLSSFRLTEVMATEDHPLRVLRHELRLHRRVTEISLDSFSEQEVGDYLARRFPDLQFDEPFVRALHQHTDGLPLFLVNAVDELVAQGAFDGGAPRDGRSIGRLEVPENLAGVIAKQLGRLGAETRRVLEAAAVCGFEFRPRLVAEALGADADAIAMQCERLAADQQWLKALEISRLADGSLDARYAFLHALYKRALYQGIGALTRANLHHRIAIAMERGREVGMRVTPAELATHYELAHDALAAARHYADAAESAHEAFAPAEALALAERAATQLAQVPESPARTQLDLRLSLLRGVLDSQRQGMSSDAAGSAYEKARAIGDKAPESAAQGWVLGGVGQVHYGRAEYGAAREAGHRIREIAERHAEPALDLISCTLIGLTESARGDRAAAARWLQRGLELYGALAGRLPQARFFVDPGVTIGGHLAMELAALGQADAARERARETMAHGRACQHPMAHSLSLRCAAMVDLELGDDAAALDKAAALRAIADAHDITPAKAHSRLIAGCSRARLGEPGAGLQAIDDGLAILEKMGLSAGTSRVHAFAAEALSRAGRLDDADARLDAGFAFAERTGERAHLPELRVLRGRIALARGDEGLARRAFEAAGREARLQHAAWVALEAAVACCELPAPSAAQRVALADALATVTQGADTVLVRAARSLLAG
jgi:DNA-binding winged helix-turn-helix (wHTH) protein